MNAIPDIRQPAAAGEVLRLATEADLSELLRWRNDPETRRLRNDPRLITESEHRAWFARRQASASKVYVFERDGVPCGNITLDVGDDGTEVGWIIAPEFRGRGLAAKMVRAALPLCPVKPIWAKAREDNAASIRVARACGFLPTERRSADSMRYFELPA